MENNTEIVLLTVIVNVGQAIKVLHTAKKQGATGCTTFLGKGTVYNKFLEFFELSDIRKEIVLIVTNETTAKLTLEILDREFKFKKPNHGIAFTTNIGCLLGSSSNKCNENVTERSENKSMYNIITVILEKGKAEDAIDAAAKAGSKGGTIINARGSGIHETGKLFSMEIEPEKEIVLILSKAEKTEAIVSALKSKLKIEEPGNGIIYVQSAVDTYGIYE